jgi:HEAT repeat protein
MAAQVLGKMGAKAVEPLMDVRKDRNAKVRRDAVRALALIPGDATTQALLDALSDEDVEVQFTATTELTQRAPVDRLIEALDSRNRDVRKNAIEILGELREKRAADHMIAALKDRNSSIREKAAYAVGRIGDPRAGEALLVCLQDGVSFVRRNAAYALGEIREPKAVDPLIKALKDESPFVRKNAARALARFRDTRAIEPLVQTTKDDPDPYVVEAAKEALTRHTSIASLIEGLDDDSPVVQKNSEYALFLMTGQHHGKDHDAWKEWWRQKNGADTSPPEAEEEKPQPEK